MHGSPRLDELYEILEELGRGAFGRVYRARRRSSGQVVALKVLQRNAAADDAALVERFQRESQLSSTLHHPNIVPLFDAGSSGDDLLFAAYGFVPGTTLRALLDAEGALAVHEAVHLMAQVLDALACAHRHGIVHRDLKPENIMVTRTGARRNALVLDFGLGGFSADGPAAATAGLARPGEFLGTPGYCAPEQLRGDSTSPRSDLFSWGLVFLECLTGTAPVPGGSVGDVIHRQLGPEPVALPDWLRSHPLGRILEVATAKQAARRTLDAEQVLPVLAAIAASSDPLPEPQDGGGEQRRQLTVVCCRLVPDGAAAADFDELDGQLAAAGRAVRDAVHRAGGLTTSLVADRLLAVFGLPQAREDDARRAVRLSSALVTTVPPTAPAVALSAGVHTGLVTVSDPRHWAALRLHEFAGATPARASALADRARPGDVLLSDATCRLVGDEFEVAAVDASAFRLGARRPTAAAAPNSRSGEAPLVGRDLELQRLSDAWTRAAAGLGTAVAITGEAGIGKSRLLRELRRRQAIATTLTFHCAEESRGFPLRPVIEALLGQEQPIERVLDEHGLALDQYLPLFTALLALPPDPRFAPLHLTPERQKELTLRALVTLACRFAERAPLLLVVENLQWADPTTIEFARLLVQTLRADAAAAASVAMLVVLTTRPDGVPSWGAAALEYVVLQRLPSPEVARMVSAGAATADLPAALVDEVVRRAEGVPLFVEELTRLVVAAHAAGRDAPDRWRAGAAVEIPPSLRELLTARLDHVSPASRETAQLAAVLGREFTQELLAAVSPKDPHRLREEMVELSRAGLILQRHSRRDKGFVFRHALLRDAAYEAMTRGTRQLLHRRVADVLRAQPMGEARPDLIAWHSEHGGDIATAVAHWTLAGTRSYQRAAYAEALSVDQHALDLVRGLEPDAATRRLEIDALVGLGSALLATRGWAVAEVEATFGRAWELSETLGGEPPMMVLYGVWGVRVTRSDRAGVEAMLPRLRTLAARSTNPSLPPFATGCLLAAAYWRGDYVAALQHLEDRAFGFRLDEHGDLDPGDGSGWNLETGDDGRLYSWMFAFSILWARGYADRARAMRDAALARTARREPTSLSIVLGFGAMLSHDCGDVAHARALGERLIALSEEQQLFFWWAPGACAVGRALSVEGHHDAGISLLRQALDRYRLLGVMCSYNYYLTYLAEAYLVAGRLDECLATLDESQNLCATLLARLHEPELLRLRARVAAARGEPADAEAALHRALAMAERDGSPAYGLRAAVDLATLLHARGDRAAAAAVLAPAMAAIHEGRDTTDWRAASALRDAAAVGAGAASTRAARSGAPTPAAAPASPAGRAPGR